MTHAVELEPLTRLMLDLKKQALGYSFTPITMDRLDECARAIQQISRCRKQGLYK
jgi:hypothetical protein